MTGGQPVEGHLTVGEIAQQCGSTAANVSRHLALLVARLRGLLPICMKCKKIRNDKGYWERVEAYVSRRSDAQFSHGICPDCEKKFYSEFLPLTR